MPFIDGPLPQGDIARIAPPAPPGKRPSVLDTLAAAAIVNNEAGALYDGISSGFLTTSHKPVEGYDALADIEDTEDAVHALRFLESESPSETAAIRQQIHSEERNRETIRQAGGWGIAASIAFGGLSPSTLAALSIPGGGVTRVWQAARMIGGGLAVDIPSEMIFHQAQVTRTAEDSAWNIAGGVLLNGILGAAIAPRITRAEFDDVARTIDTELRAPEALSNAEGSTAGSASVSGTTSLADEGVARGGEWLARSVGKISPLARLITSPAKAARQAVQQLAEIPFVLEKNARGIRTPVAVETKSKRWDAVLARTTTGLDAAWSTYRKRVRADGERPMGFRSFRTEISIAMRRGDDHMIPEIAREARRLRATVIEPIKQRAIRAGLLPADVETIGAISYLPRLYDVRRIKANMTEWDRLLRESFESQSIDRLEAAELAKQVTSSILGSTRGFIDLGADVVARAGNLQQRTIRIPDEVLEPWLVNDVEDVLTRYVRSVAPQLEMASQFGDLELTQVLQNVIDDYGIRRELARGNDNLMRQLESRMRSDLDDIRGIRDRILGKYGLPADPDSALVRGARLMRSYNYVRLLGGQVLSSIADVGKIVMRQGLVRTGHAMAHFATHLTQWKLAREDSKRLGIGLDWVLNTRGATFGEIGEWAETPLERGAEWTTNSFTRVTGMATWNSTMKFLATALEQDQILELAARRVAGGAPNRREATILAEIGIDDALLTRIGREFTQHGEHEGLRRARLDLWQDREAREILGAALLKSADTMVLTKGVGDTPLLMSNELVKTLLQFKSFGMAAVNRVAIPAAQGLARGDVAAINGLSLMLGLGVLRYVSKQWTADQPIDTKPDTLVREAIDGAGLTLYLADPYDVAAGITGAPRWSRYTDRHWTETALGPTAGTVTDFGLTLEGMSSGELTRADVHKVRKLLPLQNLFYLRRAINALEQETGDALGAQETRGRKQ